MKNCYDCEKPREKGHVCDQTRWASRATLRLT